MPEPLRKVLLGVFVLGDVSCSVFWDPTNVLVLQDKRLHLLEMPAHEGMNSRPLVRVVPMKGLDGLSISEATHSRRRHGCSLELVDSGIDGSLQRAK